MCPGTALGFFWALGGMWNLASLNEGLKSRHQLLRNEGSFTGFLLIWGSWHYE